MDDQIDAVRSATTHLQTIIQNLHIEQANLTETINDQQKLIDQQADLRQTISQQARDISQLKVTVVTLSGE